MATKKKASTAKKKGTSTKPQAKKTAEKRPLSERIGSEILGVILLALAVLIGLYLYQPQTAGLGHILHVGLFAGTGMVAYALPPLMGLLGVISIASSKQERIAGSKLVVVICIILIIAFVHLISSVTPYQKEGGANETLANYISNVTTAALSDASIANKGGGIIGGLLCYFLFVIGGKPLCWVVLLGGLLICLLLLTKFSLKTFTDMFRENIHDAFERHDEDSEIEIPVAEPRSEKKKLYTEQLGGEQKPAAKIKSHHVPFDEAFTVPDDAVRSTAPDPAFMPLSGRLEKRSAKPKPVLTDTTPVPEEGPVPDAVAVVRPKRKLAPTDAAQRGPVTTPAAPSASPDEPLADMDKPAANEKLNDNAPIPDLIIPETGGLPAYVPPDIDCLNKPRETYAKPTDSPREMGEHLIEVLESFNIQAKIVNIVVGPVVTRFELQPAPGIRVNKITALSNDIAMALAAQRVRIEAPIPGKAAVGIEIPNKDAATVLLRDIIDSDEFRDAKSPVTMALGKDIAGKIVTADLAKMPHMLIAGATGSGKSVCINSIIVSMIYRSGPADLKLILIDPKQVELSVFGTLPQLLVPVVTDPKKAASALRWAVNEMETRYKKFSELGARDLKRYNELQEFPTTKLPKVVVIIDELADLMMVAPDEVEEAICRVAQLGRAAGIHLIVATQRPSADVITGLIKANIPSRCAFAVSSAIDSRIILDSAGAEKLLGRGDMLFHPNGASKPVRLQCAFVSDEEVERVAAHFASTEKPQFDSSVIADMNGSAKGGAQGGVFGEGKQEDELLGEGVRIVLESGQASISMIQRRLRVGYARAARLIDIMEQHHYVSGFDGSKPRKVLITRAMYEDIFGGELGSGFNEPDEEAEEIEATDGEENEE